MSKKLILAAGITAAFTITSCGNGSGSDADSLKNDTHAMMMTRIDSIYKKMSQSNTYDPSQAMDAMRMYVEFSTKYPKDSMTAEYLFRASDIAQGTGNYQQAAEYLETILSEHTMYTKYPDALFSAALVYDEHLENVNHGGDRAIQLYDLIINKYPGSNYAEQSAVLKTYVGKPDSVFYNDVRRKADSIEALK